jgi:predicted RNA-binding Zn-ribbon protein involved in translation (DUF1610 family)
MAKSDTYVCEDCDRAFSHPAHLGRHRQAIHPEQPKVTSDEAIKAPEPEKPPRSPINFCYACGCDLQSIDVGVIALNFCPACGEGIGVLSQLRSSVERMVE